MTLCQRKKITFLVFAAVLFLPLIASASDTDGTIDSTSKYAWGSQIGWVNFGTSGGNVHVTDSGLSGYAWSKNYGWINLDPTNSGISNNSEGNLSGYAWGENIGWIDFDNVSIDSSGNFSGTASSSLGTITFDCTNCAVKTDWRPSSTRTPPTVINVGPGGAPAPTPSSPPADTSEPTPAPPPSEETTPPQDNTGSLIDKLNPPPPLEPYVPISNQEEIIKPQELIQAFPELQEEIQNLGGLEDPKNLFGKDFIVSSLGGAASFLSGIPLSEASQDIKAKLPVENVFARTADEKLDLSLKISIDAEGRVQKTMQSISGADLLLNIKPAQGASNVKGFIVLTKDQYNSLKRRGGILSSIKEQASALISLLGGGEEKKFILEEFNYEDKDGDGIFSAILTAPPNGKYELFSVIDYGNVQKEVRVNLDVNGRGYVFRKSNFGEVRIENAIVSLYYEASSTGNYEIWGAGDYGQDNPQTTDQKGEYYFAVPAGKYYLTVQASGYKPYKSDLIEVSGPSSFIDKKVELHSNYPWAEIDWKTILIVLLIAGLFYSIWKSKVANRN